uniref:Uncharacterized protein n=1 Tax=Romanomermis culicivorax TaxID=13658 RepID=A0A915KPJ8_ROMCU
MISASENEEKNMFRYKMLENGQKSAVQGCLVEGKTWPPFQKIALRVFSSLESTASVTEL